MGPARRRLFWLICVIAGVRLRKVTGRIPTREELKGAFIVSNHTMTGDPGLLHFMLADNARVVHKKNVGSFDIITRHKIQVGDDKAEVRETILQGIKNDPTPIIIYPEGATTNGQVGLLRYAAFIFGLNRPVHPVGLRCAAPLAARTAARGSRAKWERRRLAGGRPPQVLPGVLVHPDAHAAAAVLVQHVHRRLPAVDQRGRLDAARGRRRRQDARMEWAARTHDPRAVLRFDLRRRAQQTRHADEPPEKFAERVQHATARAIGLTPTKFTATDKAMLRKIYFPTPAKPDAGGHKRPATPGGDATTPTYGSATPASRMSPSPSVGNLGTDPSAMVAAASGH